MNRVWWTLVAGSCLACGGGGGLGKPVAVFPSKAELGDMLATRAEPVAQFKTVEVSRWEMKAAVPAPGSAYPEAGVWDRMFASSVRQTGGGLLSAELRCAAEETARFYIENGGLPDDATRRYLGERCGSTLVSLRLGWLTGEVPDSTPDEEVVKHYADDVRKLVDDSNLDAASLVGLSVARAKGQVAVVAYSGRPVAKLSQFSPLMNGTSVTLEGTVSADAAYALALVNQGESGVLACEPDRKLKLPHFRMTCPVAEGDQLARIELATRKPGRVLMDTELGALVRRSDDAGLVYEPVKQGSTALAADGLAFRSALIEELNEARSAAGRGALSLEDAQSVVNQKLAPHLLQASFDGNEDLVDRIGLGVLAGWDVNGLIRDGGIYWGTVTSTRSPGRWLSYALESPLARFILLDPDMSRVAIGAEAVGPGVMALVTTYAFFQSKDHSADEDRVFSELVKRRAARGHGAPARVLRARAVETALARVAANQLSTEAALQQTIELISSSEQRPVSGWMVETSDLRQIDWPDLLVAQEPLSVEIGVTHYKAPGGAWGQYAVFFVIRGGGRDTARLDRRPGAEPARLRAPAAL